MGKKRKRNGCDNSKSCASKDEQVQQITVKELKENQGPGSIGYVYSQALALYILLKSFNVKSCDFEFAQEHKYAKIFDDIVIKEKAINVNKQIPYCFMQLKYKENPEKTDDIDVFLFNENIYKYVKSQIEMKSEKQFDCIELANLMLVTNMKFKKQQENEWEVIKLKNDAFFNNDAFTLFKLKFDPNANIVQKLKNKNLEKKEIEDFFSQFIVVKTEDYEQIYKLINEEMLEFINCTIVNVDIIQQAFQMKMFVRASLKGEGIFKDKYYWKTEIEYFVNSCARMIVAQKIDEIKMKYHDVNFKPESLFDVSDTKGKVINIVSPNSTKITKRRLYCSLKSDIRKNVIFVKMKTDPNLILKAFSHPESMVLVLYQETETFETISPELLELISSNEKGIIVISNEKINIKINFKYVDGTSTLADLQNEQLPGKLIFQGKDIDFLTWSDDKKMIVDDLSLEQLFDGKNIEIGTVWSESDSTFIERKIFGTQQGGRPIFKYEEIDDNIDNTNVTKIYLRSTRTKKDFAKLKLPFDSNIHTKWLDNDDVIIVTGETEKFKEFCATNADENVHWFGKIDNINVNSKALVWVCTAGSKDKILPLVEEISARNHTIDSISDRIVLVSAGAGMGKTYLMKQKAKISADINNWVILLELGKLTETFKKWENESFENAKQFIKDMAINKNTLEERLFDKYLECGQVTLLVDAFDEICSTYFELVSKLLKNVCQINFKSIWITTRPYNIKGSIESELNVSAYELMPFDKRMYVEFFKSYFEKHLDDFDEKCFQLLINTLEVDIGMDILTLPIHCDMILQMLISDGLTNIKEFNDVKYQESLSKLTNRCLLYERFFEKKLFSQYVEKSGNSAHHPGNVLNIKNQKKLYEQKFIILALQALLTKDNLDELNVSSDFDDDIIQEIERGDEYGGFVEQIVQGIPKFVHKTYSEFLTAKYFVQKITKRDKTVTKFLSGIIFREEFKDMWSFFDDMIFEKSENCELHKMIKGHKNIESFANESSSYSHHDSLGRTVLSIVALYIDKYDHFEYYFNLLHNKIDLKPVDCFGQTTITYLLERGKIPDILNALSVHPDAFVDLIKYEHIITIRHLLNKSVDNSYSILLNHIFNTLIYNKDERLIEDLIKPIIGKIIDIHIDPNITVLLINYAFKLFSSKQILQIIDAMVEENCYADNFEELIQSLRYSSLKSFESLENEITSTDLKILKKYTFISNVYADYFLSDFFVEKIKQEEQKFVDLFENIMFKDEYERLVIFIDILMNNNNVKICKNFFLTNFYDNYFILNNPSKESRLYLNNRDELNRTPLMLFAKHLAFDSKITCSGFENLVLDGGDIDIVDRYGNTALKYAVKKRNYSLSELILWCFPDDICLDSILINFEMKEDIQMLLKEVFFHQENIHLLTDCIFDSLIKYQNVHSSEVIFNIIVENLFNINKATLLNVFKYIKTVFGVSRIQEIVKNMVSEDCFSYSFIDIVECLKYSSISSLFPEIEFKKKHQNLSTFTFMNMKDFSNYFAAIYLAEAIKNKDDIAVHTFHKILYEFKYAELVYITNVFLLSDDPSFRLHLCMVYAKSSIIIDHPIREYFRKNRKQEFQNVDILKRTPLMLASFYSHNHSYIVESLLKNDVDLNSVDCFGYTALHYAIMSGNYQSAETILLYQPNDSNMYKIFDSKNVEFLKTVLHTAIDKDYIFLTNSIIKSLVNSKKKMLIKIAYNLIFSNIHRISSTNFLIIVMKNVVNIFTSEQLAKMINKMVQYASLSDSYDSLIKKFRNFAFFLTFPKENFINVKCDLKIFRFTNEVFKEYFAADFIAEEIVAGKQEFVELYRNILFSETYKNLVKIIDSLLTFAKENFGLLYLIIHINSYRKYDQLSILKAYFRKNGRDELVNVDVLNRTPLMLLVSDNYNYYFNRDLLELVLPNSDALNAVDIFGNKAIDYAKKSSSKNVVDVITNYLREITQ